MTTGATEDAASGRAARPDGTDVVSSSPPGDLEPQVPDRGAGSQLAVTAGDQHERVGGGGADDHVRLLAGERLEPDSTVVTELLPRANELVARLDPSYGSR